ncbi:MAG TPA: class I SAM-dependent methyltransferase [Longimicrobiaceae bacterium]|nr:class I SAM-dependent methyltransferase [Longimicrobiaceae bacterium]
MTTKHSTNSELDRIFADLIRIQEEDPSGTDLLQYRSLATAHQYGLLYRTLTQYLKPDSSILDWGCGNGHFSFGLLELGYRTAGFSFEDFRIRPLLRSGYRFSLGSPSDPRALPYEDETFQGVTSVGVLEHVRETGGTEAGSLREIFRVLEPGGFFICFHLPNRFSLIEVSNAAIPGKHHHLYRYDSATIHELCRQAGFSLVEVRRYGALPRNVCHRLPARLRNSGLFAKLWNKSDDFLSMLSSPFCQNYLFVAQKPRTS